MMTIIDREHDIVRALADGEGRHGDAIVDAVEANTDGTVHLDAGTLDRALKHLRAGRLIVQMDRRDPAPEGAHRRCYRLTPRGRALLVPLGIPRPPLVSPCSSPSGRDVRCALRDGEERHGDLILCTRNAPPRSTPLGPITLFRAIRTVPWREAVPLGIALGASMGGVLLLSTGGTSGATGAVAAVATVCVVLRRLVAAA